MKLKSSKRSESFSIPGSSGILATLRAYLVAIGGGLLLSACASGPGEQVVVIPPQEPRPVPDRGNIISDAIPLLVDSITPAQLQKRVEQFAPASLDFDDSTLQPWERQVLRKLIEASFVIHNIYALQVSEKIPEWRAALEAQEGAGKAAAISYFDLMVGPWDRLQHDQPFLEVGPKPAGAAYYPLDMTRAEFESHLERNPADKAAFTGYFTVIRRNAQGQLTAIPYSQYYRDELTRAATLLNEAAAISQNASLSDFLRKRAAAFLSNDYYESDVAWMDITGSRIEPTIGPYEVYEDKLFGYKAAFESFITVADPAASAELDNLKDRMQSLERTLPVDDRFKSPDRAFESPIRVVDVVYNAGDARRGVQTIAFNLPNDERVVTAKGSKKVMLRNMMRAKFERILQPIGERVLDPSLTRDVQFQPWFINVLMHELANGLGPKAIRLPSGAESTVNRELKEHYSALEEAKADVTGLHNLTMLQQQGLYDAEFVRRAYVGHLGDLFRAVRFGTSEAHGKANLVQFNYFREKGALNYDAATGRFSTDFDALVRANRDLAREILTIQGEGSYQKAADLLRRYGNEPAELKQALAKLSDVPVDIKPQHPVLERISAW